MAVECRMINLTKFKINDILLLRGDRVKVIDIYTNIYDIVVYKLFYIDYGFNIEADVARVDKEATTI